MALTDGLVNYYKMDESSGKTIADSVGALTGTFRSATVTTLDAVSANITQSAGKCSNGISFTGEKQIVDSRTGTDTLAVGMAVGNQKIGQSFVATGCGLIKYVRLKRKTRTGTPTGNIIVRICADSSGSPGSSLANKSIAATDFNSLGTNEAFITVEYTGVAGTTYWLTVEQSVNSDTAHENFTYNSTGSSGVLKAYNGSSWSTVTGSLYFSVCTNDDVALASDVSVPYNAFSIGFWLKTVDATRRQLIAQQRTASSGEIEIHSTVGNLSVNCLAMENKSNTMTRSTGTVCTGLSDFGNWHHYLITNGTTYWTVYQDGIQVYQTTALTDTVNQTYRYLGSNGNSPGGIYGICMQGGMDELGFWNRELSSAEALSLVNGGLGTTYPFDFTVNVGIEGKGTVTKTPSQTTYLYGDTVTLTPTEQLGSYFNTWQGDLTSTTSTQVVTITQEYQLTSEFIEYPTIRSKSIYLNDINVTKATLQSTTTSSNDSFIFGLSNDGGTTFEEVSNNQTYTFTNSSGQEVQYQIWGKRSGLIINKIVVKVNQ